MANLRYILSVGLAVASLAVVLTYVLGAHAILQTPQAETGHGLFMSTVMSLVQGIVRGHASMSQMHGGPATDSQMQEMKQGWMHGVIGNNVLGSPATLPAGGFAVVVVTGATALAVAAFVASWKQRSFVVTGLLAAAGVALIILPLIALTNENLAVTAFQGPIVGVTVGLAILGLGVAKGIGTARAITVPARRS
jgi:hypothetical protein